MKTEITIESIQEQLEEFTINVDDEDVLMKMQELCFVYQKSSEEIALAWMAFFSSKHLDREPTLDALAQFEREELAKKKKQKSHAKAGSQNAVSLTECSPSVYDSVLPDSTTDNVLLQYSSTPSTLKRLKTPESGSKRRPVSQNDKPVHSLTPKTTLPTLSFTPSQKYTARTGRRSVVVSFGDSKVNWKGDTAEFHISVFDKETSLNKKYRYMFEKLCDRAGILNNFITELADVLQKQHGVEDWCTLDGISAHEVTVVGRVFCDQPGKMNPSSVWLEGSQEIARGRTIQLNISDLLEVTLFPGQIVAMKGIQNQDRLIVKHILTGVLPPQPTFTPELDYLQLVVAAGPFATSDTLSYDPLSDLIDYVIEFTPHVLILIGPFVDIKHGLIKKGTVAEPYAELFERHIAEIQQKLKSIGTQLVLIPSLRDIHHEAIYPIPPFVLRKSLPNVHCFSDPCILNIGGLVLGLSSTDILFHLGKEELSHGMTDRMSRLCHHILSQHNFYPLYPPSEDVSIDYEHFEQHAILNVAPHLMILPSDLRFFVKSVGGCSFINPERLTKGFVGGTFCRIAAKFHENSIPEINAEILKI